MLVVGQQLLVRGQLGEKAESTETICDDSVAVNDHCTVEEPAEVIPIKVPAIAELLHQACWIERIARLPQLQYYKAADEWLIQLHPNP